MIEKVNKFVELLKEKWKNELVSVVLFGSKLKNPKKEDSDIDILVICDAFPKDRLDRHKIIFDIAEKIDIDFAYDISCIPLLSEEAKETKPFYLGMLNLSKILYDKDNFFNNILYNLRVRLKELGSERFEDEDGYEYWILKKGSKLGEPITI